MRIRSLAIACAVATVAVSYAQRNPFAPPAATLHFAPSRTCDLIHVAVDLDVDYPNRTFTGKSVSTLAALREGISEIILHSGPSLTINSVKVGGKVAPYRIVGKEMFITTGLLQKGKQFQVELTYTSKDSRGTGFGSGGGGWHWISPRPDNATRVGFWTQGETQYNCEWAPTWDYPNDLATSETRTTVQADWSVIGNGVLVSERSQGGKKTFHWKMNQPHATYLLAVYGGPFDIKKDSWEGVDLWYVVPKGSGYLIDDSFGDTKDMLSFFSKRFGVKYPWPKYAQAAMYDFGGGMENVSATILGEGSLTEARDGFRNMSSLNAHELGHQWFGDLVTCMHWGDTWLNESFATYLQILYFGHAQGKASYDWEIEDAMQSYLAESRRYKRPLTTKLYGNPDQLFDSHSYPKGAVVLHTLNRLIGEEAFFQSLNYYLTKWRHTPVESAQLRRAFAEGSGINAEPFWSQWIEAPGHPVIDYSWVHEGGKVKLTVKQLQNTADGTPIYDIPTKAWISVGGRQVTVPVRLSKAEETFELDASTKPDAVLLDPDHDFLRETPKLNWAQEELMPIFRYAPNSADRQQAMTRLLAGQPTAATISAIVDALNTDNDLEQPTFRSVTPLGNLAKPELRSFWTAQLNHPNFDRRAQAVAALAKLPRDDATVTKLRSLVNPTAPIQVVVNSINALAAWDKAGNADIFRKALEIKDRRGRIKRAAEAALQP